MAPSDYTNIDLGPYLMCANNKGSDTVLQKRRSKRDNLGIIFYITPSKLML